MAREDVSENIRVPFVGNRSIVEAKQHIISDAYLQNIIDFTDQLHVTILNTVVNRLSFMKNQNADENDDDNMRIELVRNRKLVAALARTNQQTTTHSP